MPRPPAATESVATRDGTDAPGHELSCGLLEVSTHDPHGDTPRDSRS